MMNIDEDVFKATSSVISMIIAKSLVERKKLVLAAEPNSRKQLELLNQLISQLLENAKNGLL